MALPPELIEEVIPEADTAVLAEVTRVVEQSPQQKDPPSQETSRPTAAARQIVELKVSSVLFGALTKGALVQVVKPAGAYALKAGNHGPFVLGAGPAPVAILGRYGPDTWNEATIRQAAKDFGKQ